jgi:hypothetical protein
MSDERPRSKYRYCCDPAQHRTREDGTKAGPCQTDIAHVLCGDEAERPCPWCSLRLCAEHMRAHRCAGKGGR